MFQVGSLAVSLLDRFILSALILRVWGVEGFEDWSVLLAAAGFMNLFDLGLQQTLSNAYTRAWQSGRRDDFARLLAIGMWLEAAVLALGIATLTAWLLLGETPMLVSVREFRPLDVHLVLGMLALATLLQTVSACMGPIYRAQGRFSRGMAVEMLFQAVRVLAVVLVPLTGGGAPLAAAAYLSVSIGYTLIFLPWDLRTNLTNVRFRLAWPNASERRTISGVAPWFFAQHATTLLLNNAPIVVLSTMSDATGAVAAFLFVRMVVNFARTLLQFGSNSMSVEVARIQASGSGDEVIARHLQRASRLMCVLCGAIVGSLVPLVSPLARLWSEGTVGTDLWVAVLLAGSLLINGPFILVAGVLAMIGRARIGAASKLTTGLLSLGLCLALTKPFGALGVAAALAAGETAGLSLLLLPAAARLLQTRTSALSAKWTAYALAGLVPAALVSLGLAAALARSPLMTVAAAGVLLVPTVSLTLLFFGVSAEDRNWVWARWRG